MRFTPLLNSEDLDPTQDKVGRVLFDLRMALHDLVVLREDPRAEELLASHIGELLVRQGILREVTNELLQS